jgi:radical SAM-linked protein
VRQPPPVERLWVRYAKRGVGRFASHRDFARAFERALRRAGVPMAYSSGFNPHPRISWANPAHTGAESEAEYVEIGLAEVVAPAAVGAALDEALPPGFAVVATGPAQGSLAEALTASEWLIRWPEGPVPDPPDPAGFAPVTRETKNGPRTFDVRPAIVAMTTADGGLRAVLRHTVPLVRPDDLVAAWRPIGVGLPLVRRLAQGRLDADRVTNPLL